MFTSDNGYLFGEHRFTSKILPYEESIRVPLIIRHPSMSVASIADALVLNNDLAPTIADLAGVDPDIVVDGRSLERFLRGFPVTSWRSVFLVEGYRNLMEGNEIPPFQALRSGATAPYPERMIARWEDGSMEYYDLRADPFEIDNQISILTSEQREWVEARMNAFAACAGSVCWSLEDW